MDAITEAVTNINDYYWYFVIAILTVAGVWFTV